MLYKPKTPIYKYQDEFNTRIFHKPFELSVDLALDYVWVYVAVYSPDERGTYYQCVFAASGSCKHLATDPMEGLDTFTQQLVNRLEAQEPELLTGIKQALTTFWSTK